MLRLALIPATPDSRGAQHDKGLEDFKQTEPLPFEGTAFIAVYQLVHTDIETGVNQLF